MYMDKLMDHGNIIATIDINLIPLKTILTISKKKDYAILKKKQ